MQRSNYSQYWTPSRDLLGYTWLFRVKLQTRNKATYRWGKLRSTIKD